MQAAEWAGERRSESGMRIELPAPLRELARVVLDPLRAQLCAVELSSAAPVSPLVSGDAPPARVEPGADGWWLEHGGARERAADTDELLLRLQELELEAAARRCQWLLLRGSVVARGSQCVMTVSADDPAHVRVALALAVLEFRPVSIGLAAFGSHAGRGCLAPLPLPLAFALPAEEQEALEALSPHLLRHLTRLAPALCRPAETTAGPEPTHILFPGEGCSTGTLLRPLSPAAARARLCGALTVAPEDPSPFTAVAALLRHARGIHLATGDLASTLAQLARLLPRWNVG